jgi:DNA-binding PadR family transcriptional regulator
MMDRMREHGMRDHGPHGRGRARWASEMSGAGWGGGRRRMRRGDIRRAILVALGDGPAHGYEVMRRLEERSGGIWRPSPGSVYPTLQMLEDEAMVRSETSDGTRVYQLTESGSAEAQASGADTKDAPWEHGEEGDNRLRTLMQAVGLTAMAAKQVARAGRPEQIDRSIEVVQRARKELYQILGED